MLLLEATSISRSRSLRAFTIALIAAMGALQLGSQSTASSVTFGSVPAWVRTGS
jgi:hypothetical protein